MEKKKIDRPDPADLAAMGMTEEEFEREYQEALRRGKEEWPDELAIQTARYDAATERLLVDLANGTLLAVPVATVPDLKRLTPAQLADLEYATGGYWLIWRKADVWLPILDLIETALSSEKWMARLAGRLMGQKSSPVKAVSSRANGKKGGRPRKKPQAS